MRGMARNTMKRRRLMILELVESFPNAVWTSAFLLAYTVQVLRVGEAWWGFQGSAFMVGSILGRMLVTVLSRRFSHQLGRTIGISSAIIGGIALAYAGVPVPIIAVALSWIDGVVFNVRYVVEQSMIQGSVESHFLARVFAVQGLLLSVMSILSTVGMSYLADRIGVQAVYVVAGAGYFVVFAIAMGSKVFWRYVLPTERMAGAEQTV